MEITKKAKDAVLVADVEAGKTFKANGNNYFLKLAQHGVIQNKLCGALLPRGEVRQFKEEDTCQIVDANIEILD